MIIDAKTGTINAVLLGKDSKEGGVSFAFRYPARVDILTMDKDQIFNAVCEVHGDMSPIKDMVYDIKLTFTADPVPINPDEKEMSLDGLYKSFKQSLEEIDQQSKAIDLAVDEISRMTGGMTRTIALDKNLDYDEKVATHKKNIKRGLFDRCRASQKNKKEI